MIKNIIQDELKRVLKELGYDNILPEVLPTTDSKFGDYFSNLILRLKSPDIKQTQEEIAKIFEANLQKNDEVFATEFAKNGLLNFRVRPGFLQKQLRKIIEQNQTYGRGESGKGKKARVEFVSANPTGPLHIGNARGGPLGDTIASVLETNGYEVLREYYNNDIGTQVDIFGDSLIFHIKQKLSGEVYPSVSTISLTKTDTGVFEDTAAYKGEYLDELAERLKKELKLESPKDLLNKEEVIRNRGVEILFEEILSDCKAMGISFDQVFHESKIQEELTQKVIEELKKKGLTKEKDSALWFAPNDKFLEDRESVLERSEGRRPTYFADDIAYHKLKFETKPDLVVNIWGSNHHGHIPRMQAALQALGEDVNSFKVILYQFVRVKKGNEIVKMSKRAGNFVTAREVLEQVGKDAFRYFLLMHDPNTHMDFDIEQAKKQSAENPVFYIQYAHARLNSVLETAKKSGISLENLVKSNTSLLKTDSEVRLLKQLVRFPELLENISLNFSVHLLPAYSYELANLFHKYYEKERVITTDKALTQARLALIMSIKVVLSNSLKMMGITAPDHM